MKCPACGNDNPADVQFCVRCGTSLSAHTGIGTKAVQDNSIRYHGLDALRGMAMLLGIVLHAALPYMPNVEAFWPADESSSHVINTIFQFIHIWRMPLFFILAGFFANLIISKKSWRSWWGNRFLRIALPIIVFFPVMSLTLPWIFKYGKTGDFIFFYSDVGQPFHLWFLWQLMIFVISTAIFRLPYLLGVGVLKALNRIGLGFIGNVFGESKSVLSSILFRSRFPIVFIILCSVINLPTQGELIVNPIASGLYFVIGYSLYGNASLFTFLKAHWRRYFLAGLVAFTLYMILESKNLVTDIYSTDMKGYEYLKAISEPFAIIIVSIKIICGVLFSYAFIGLAEKRFGAYNPRLRFISDGAYWMYLIHLPIVTFITFFMFNFHMPIEIKFLIAIVVTSIICLGTYKYFVRSTPIGILLNGRRYPFKMTGL
jgi:peptidoglycan/LPS O-acetylase OafA/YrhL